MKFRASILTSVLLLGLACDRTSGPTRVKIIPGNFDRISLEDISGIWGGQNLYVSADGSASLQVERGGRELRYTAKLSSQQVQSLLDTLNAQNFFAITDSKGMVIPDEGHPRITLKMQSGESHSAIRWDHDQPADFAAIHEELNRLATYITENSKGVEVPIDRKWRPAGF